VNPLAGLLQDSVALHPERTAVVDAASGETATYADLNARAEAIAQRLRQVGVSDGHRVGIRLAKSIDSLASVFAILKCDAAYVPVDAAAPPERNEWIFKDCAVTAIIDRDADGALRVEPQLPIEDAEPLEGLAYILYTSGSTGNPKGVMVSHENALSFINWCSETFQPTPEDRFSSHAPFHFDLSILDIYAAIKHGAAVVLIGEALGKNARALAPVIEEQKITMWYSTPTVLRLLTESGDLENRDLSALRVINFAGEVFPIQQLRALKEKLPAPRYFNLYGPTETNVCTYLEIPHEIPADQDTPFPIGHLTSNVRGRVIDENGKDVKPGEEGELVIAGGPVMMGYWNLPGRTADAFLPGRGGLTWYLTGDIVRDLGGGNYDYVSRRDRMIKRRGYRVELGEIETGLYKFPGIAEVAAIAVPDPESGMRVRAFVRMAEQQEKNPSLLQMKVFCSKVLLPYMIPDSFEFLPALPKTSTDKIDYQKLTSLN
jgi:amino acid adenylation domain-containing protein